MRTSALVLKGRAYIRVTDLVFSGTLQKLQRKSVSRPSHKRKLGTRTWTYFQAGPIFF